MSEHDRSARAGFVDISDGAVRDQDRWPSLVVQKEAIDLEIERLLDIERGGSGRRSAAIVHPHARAPGLGFAPGIDVTLNVLRAGEATRPRRQNSNQIEITIAGSGVKRVNGVDQRLDHWDVSNIPSMQVYSHHNDGAEPWVRLTYSNAPLLEKLEIHHIEDIAAGENVRPVQTGSTDPGKAKRARDLALKRQITDEGAWLLGYEYLIDIDVIESRSLVWPWKVISDYLPDVEAVSSDYTGRRLFVLYNPATERRIGTTHSFFATISSSPPNNHHIPHRHSSSAINYYLRGNGYSKVGNKKLEWKAGDLILSAPGWVMHSHHSGDAITSALTIQDEPLQIAMESLIWQERITDPIKVLGSEAGFQSNLLELARER